MSPWCVLPLLLVLVACRAPAPMIEVVNLVEQLPGADVQTEAVVIDLGDPGARGHLVSGWSRDERRPKTGETFVWSLGDRSVVAFYLGWTRRITVAARCRPFRFDGAPAQRLTVELNDHPVHVVEMVWGPQTIEFVLPAQLQRTGDNVLAFVYGVDRAPVEVVSGSKDERRLAVAWDELRFGGAGIWHQETGLADAGRDGHFLIPVGARFDFFIDLPRGAVLHLGEIGLVGGGSAVVNISLMEDLEESTELVALFPPVNLARVDLRNRGGPVRLRFEVLPGVADPARAVQMATAFIAAPAQPAGMRGGEVASGDAPSLPVLPGVRPNMIIYLVDALRPDRLGCYGDSRALSPRLDEFARQAVLFEDAVAQSSWTKAAVASLFTGQWPPAHGVNGPDDALPSDLETLPEILQSAGYRTGAVSANAYVNTPFGFGRGFDHFVFIPDGDNDAVFVNEEAFVLVDQLAPRPFFLYLHAIDPHAPYRPPAAFRRRFAGAVADPSVGEVDTVRGLVLGTVAPSPDLTRDLEALYDAEVAANDAAFGELLDFLEARGLYEDSVILFIADHGEAFGEHGSFTHGIDLYPEVVAIPLVLRLPGGALGGLRVARPVQQTDVMATLLELAGIERPAAVATKGLFRARDGRDMALTYLDYWGKHGAAAVTERWKLIWPLSRDFGSGMELYDRRSDPGETRNLVDERPVVAGLLATALRRRVVSRAQAHSVEIDAETRRDLEALGYVDPS